MCRDSALAHAQRGLEPERTHLFGAAHRVCLIGEYTDEPQRQALMVDNPMKLYKFTS